MVLDRVIDRGVNAKGARSREQLLEATLRVIATAGAEAVTYRRVADEAGLTRGAVTHHFASREDIILQAFRHYIGTVDGQLSEISASVRDKGIDGVIEGLVRYHAREFLDPSRVLAEYELILFAARNEEIGRAVRAWEDALIARLEARLEAAGAAQPRQSAHLMLAVFRAFELESLTRRNADPEDLRRRLRALVHVKPGNRKQDLPEDV